VKAGIFGQKDAPGRSQTTPSASMPSSGIDALQTQSNQTLIKDNSLYSFSRPDKNIEKAFQNMCFFLSKCKDNLNAF